MRDVCTIILRNRRTCICCTSRIRRFVQLLVTQVSCHATGRHKLQSCISISRTRRRSWCFLICLQTLYSLPPQGRALQMRLAPDGSVHASGRACLHRWSIWVFTCRPSSVSTQAGMVDDRAGQRMALCTTVYRSARG